MSQQEQQSQQLQGSHSQREPHASQPERMTLREWLAVASMGATAFIFNTSEFMPIGLLVDIAASFNISEASAGALITAYAWAVCILSLPLMVFASRFNFKPLLLGVVALFAVGQAASALAVGYWSLLFARLLVACAHAVFWSIVSPVAVQVVAVQHRQLALSGVVTGSAVAQILGLPLGRVIGLALGWRMSFACIAAVAVLVIVMLAVLIPRLAPSEPFRLKELPALVSNRTLLGIFAVTAVMATAYYTGYSYIEPFMQQMGHFGDEAITAALMVFGVAGICGSFLFARFYEGQRRRFWIIRLSLGGIALALALMLPAMLGFGAMCAVCVLWGVCATSFNVAFQSEILRFAPHNASAVAMSIFSGIFNLGIGGGSAIGGTVVTSIGIQAVGLTGAAIGAAGLLVACVFLIPAMRRQTLA